MRAPLLAAATVLASWASPASARADGPAPSDRRAEPPQIERLFDELSGPRLPAPMSLPELTHPDFDASLGWLVGSATSEDARRSTSAIALVRASGEARIGALRRVYLGVTWPLALALPASGSGGRKALLGNVEAHVRVVFPMPSWLALGAALGVTAPTASFTLKSGSEEAALAAAALEPTEIVQLTPGVVAIRPSLDLRLHRGPFVFQVRDGVDVVVDSLGAERARTLGRVVAHAGVLTAETVELSVEASQVYFFSAEVPDDKRTAMTIGPGVRWSLGSVDVGLGGVTNLFAPLTDGMDRFYAARVSLVGHIR